MTNASRIASLSLALLVSAGATHARPDTHQTIRGWSAVDETEAATLLERAADLPLIDMATSDQPYCADHAQISRTLQHDFSEKIVASGQFSGLGAQLWGSDQLGTWTLVAPRGDGNSCIIASGIGFQQERDSRAYFALAGLRAAPQAIGGD